MTIVEVPGLVVGADCSRVAKKEVMPAIISVGNLLVVTPPQLLPDLFMQEQQTTANLELMSKAVETMSSAKGARKAEAPEAVAPGPGKKKSSTKLQIIAVQNALKSLNFNFSWGATVPVNKLSPVNPELEQRIALSAVEKQSLGLDASLSLYHIVNRRDGTSRADFTPRKCEHLRLGLATDEGSNIYAAFMCPHRTNTKWEQVCLRHHTSPGTCAHRERTSCTSETASTSCNGSLSASRELCRSSARPSSRWQSSSSPLEPHGHQASLENR